MGSSLSGRRDGKPLVDGPAVRLGEQRRLCDVADVHRRLGDIDHHLHPA
jgi:hypothetical protein